MWNEGLAAAARRRMAKRDRGREGGRDARKRREEGKRWISWKASERAAPAISKRETGWLARMVSEIRGEVAHSYPSHHFYPITVMLGVYCDLGSRDIELSCWKGSKLSKSCMRYDLK